jgi:hypothetical protein
VPRIQTFDVAFPPPEHAGAIAAALRAAGWEPEAEGELLSTVLADVLMIIGAGGDAREVAAYLEVAPRKHHVPLSASLEAYLPVAEQLVRAGRHEDEPRPAV